MAQISREVYNFHIIPTGKLWSDDHGDEYDDGDDDEEVISGNKPPGLCDQDVYVQMSDSAHELIIGTSLTEHHFSFGL